MLWKAIVDKSGRDYFSDPVFRITSPDVIPSREIQIHPLRIDIDLARFLFLGRKFFWSVENFWPVKNIFCRSRIFWAAENFFVLQEFSGQSRVLQEFSGQSRIVFVGQEFSG